MNDCVYIFLDEAGNLDFSRNGTQFFVLTSISTRRPFQTHRDLDDYKHDCLESDLDTEYFHCAEDNTHVRRRVFGLIAANMSALRIDSLVVEKSKTEPSLQEDKRFYPEMLGYLLKFVFQRELKSGARRLVVITDTIPVQKKRNAIEKGIQQTLARHLPVGVHYRILHHASRSHYGLQVADYCCWAVFRKWQRQDTEHYDSIKDALRSEFDIFQKGTRHYY